MVKLRLKRIGKKQAPFYRIVAADSRVNRDGKYIELIGTYDPLKEIVNIDKELALKWLNDGAQPTDSVRDLFSKQGVMKELHDSKLLKAKDLSSKKEAKPKAKKETTKKPAAKTAAKPKAE